MLPTAVLHIIVEYVMGEEYKLLDWIDPKKLIWDSVCQNSHIQAFRLLQTNPDMMNWCYMSMNPADHMLDLLEVNLDKIDWGYISANKSHRAMILIQDVLNDPTRIDEANKVNWRSLSYNSSAIPLLEVGIKDPDIVDKIDWELLSANSKAGELLEVCRKDPNLVSRIKPIRGYLQPHPIPLIESNLHLIDWFVASQSESIFTSDVQATNLKKIHIYNTLLDLEI